MLIVVVGFECVCVFCYVLHGSLNLFILLKHKDCVQDTSFYLKLQ